MDSVVVLVECVEACGSFTVVQDTNASRPAMVDRVRMILIMAVIYLSVVVVVVVDDFDSWTLAAGSTMVFLTMTFEAMRLSPSFA